MFFKVLGLYSRIIFFYSKNINNCSNIWSSLNLIGCTWCINCSNLLNESYCINNQKYTEQEFFIMYKKYIWTKDFSFPINVPINNTNSQNCIGKYIFNSNQIEWGLFVHNTINWKNIYMCWWVETSEHLYDCSFIWMWWCRHIYMHRHELDFEQIISIVLN